MIHLLAGTLLLLARDATPEATVRGALDALNHQSWAALFNRIDGAKVVEATATLEKMNPKKGETPNVDIKDVKITINGDTATGTVSLVFPMPAGQPGSTQSSDVTLKNIGGDWKITGGKGMFSELVIFAKNPGIVGAQAHSAAVRTSILSNFKQIALGVLLYSNDHNDKFALAQATLKAKLQPYIKNDKIWLGPDKKPMDVRINPNIVGKPMTAIALPAQTVMLSYGPKSSLVYLQGRTVIAYVDGHVKMITKEAAAKLIW